MRNTLKFAILACASLIGASHGHAQQVDSTTYFKIKELQENVKREFAPDRRTKIVAIQHADIPQNQYILETTEKDAQFVLEQKAKDIPAHIQVKLLPDASVEGKTAGVIRLSVANMRTFPDNAAELTSQVLLGTQVDLLQKKGGEYRVRTPDGYIAWVPSSSIAAMDETEIASWRQAEKVIYTTEFGRSYSEPNEKSQRVSDLVYGDILKLTGQKGNFYAVAYPDGRKGYIRKSESLTLKSWLDSRNPTAENIIASAKSMLGLPYLWGGTSVKGVDCSGFTKTSFFMNGFVIPRDASQQVLAGQQIDILDSEGHFDPEKALKNLKPADLLFFAAGKNSNPNARVTHVALYIGNGTFIHAAGLVRINSMLKDAPDYDDFQTRTVVAARRYLGVQDSAIQKIAESNYYTKK
ncbi:NlpC/P60 family protein [Sphingobacterium thalpophilum]|uniref:Dipeptidyl-peptidase 6 n=1 Tax=Sphingobacterium thalpophilum TaxID=259 RepID=A0A4U9VMM9_9SPHI|nr:NlpC/P60 family protein [Sphingobacterium thalpophilum]VTR44631.1 Dipeptidyl-peptidase 6 [Sphingobacterium thalpophilum]